MHQLIWEVGRFYQQQRQNLRQFLDILVEVDIRRSEAKEHVKNETVHTDAILLPELAFDASRILEQAITILKKYAGIDLFPCAFKERRRFFWAFLCIFGNSKTLMGYSLRPQLPSQVATLTAWVILLVRRRVPLNLICPVSNIPLTRLKYHDRLKALRRLENGTASGG